MNGPQKMYQTRQIIQHDMSIDLPKCMYKMKNIHATTANGICTSDHVVQGKKLDIIDQNQKLPGMAELEVRQEEILKNLSELKQQILQLRNSISASAPVMSSTTVSSTLSSPTIQDLVNHPEIIINANPNKPPYSLLAVQKLWGNYIHLKVESYTHSTVNSVPETSLKLAKALENYQPTSKVPQLTLRLIWKNVGIDSELLVIGAPILSETNMLRYLARISPNPELNYEKAVESDRIDSVLDICYLLSRTTTKTGRQVLLQSLNSQLGKTQWLCGRNTISIADIAASSVIKQVTAVNEISANINKWLQRCEAVA